MFMFLVSCAPPLTDEELEAELAKLTPEEREQLLADLESKESGALAGNAFKAYVGKVSQRAVQFLAVCGNSKPNPGELCDDGNKVNGDGCSSICKIEKNFKCTEAYAKDPSIGYYVPSICTPIKPDLVVSSAEFNEFVNASGKYTKITAVVKNIGLISTGGNFHTMFQNSTAVPSPLYVNIFKLSSALAAGAEVEISFHVLCPVSLPVTVTADKSTVAAYKNKIAESDETNNGKQLVVTCT